MLAYKLEEVLGLHAGRNISFTRWYQF